MYFIKSRWYTRKYLFIYVWHIVNAMRKKHYDITTIVAYHYNLYAA